MAAMQTLYKTKATIKQNDNKTKRPLPWEPGATP